MANLWEQGGLIVEDAIGILSECATCPCDEEEACTYCETGTTPPNIDVTLPTLSNSNCSYCTTMSGQTYRCVQDSIDKCLYYHRIHTDCNNIDLYVTIGANQVTVELRIADGKVWESSIFWIKSYGVDPVPCDFTYEDVDLDNVVGGTEGCAEPTGTHVTLNQYPT